MTIWTPFTASIVEQKPHIGDWEGDTLIGKNRQGVVATLVERKTKFTTLAVPKTKHATLVRMERFHQKPRRIFGFKTPYELLFNEKIQLHLLDESANFIQN